MNSITLRYCLIAMISAFIICVILSPLIIPILRKIKLGQYERTDGPQSHLIKQGTPTMGGIIILLSALACMAFFAKGNSDVLAIILMTLGYGIIGFCDDFIKVVKKRSLGLRPWQKIVSQLAVSGAFLYYVLEIKKIGSELIVPFTNGYMIDVKWVYIPLMIIVIIATVNSVNLTDGLDGLCTGVTILVTTFFASIAFNMMPEIAPAMATIIGSLLAFLIFNAHPAKIFMGDTGSLALGGFLSAVAIIMQMPLFLLVVGIIYVLESLSDIIQVTSYKLYKKRVFKMAPLHHHFELCGWKETKVVAVFYIVTAIACLLGFLAI